MTEREHSNPGRRRVWIVERRVKVNAIEAGMGIDHRWSLEQCGTFEDEQTAMHGVAKLNADPRSAVEYRVTCWECVEDAR